MSASRQSSSYLRQTTQNPNPIARYAHVQRVGKSVQIAEEQLPQHATLLDFGAGEGTFLHTLGERRQDLTLVGIEPFMQSRYPEVRFIRSFSECAPASLDAITAFEVCEHLTDQQVTQFLLDAYASLKPAGILVVSVPIMYGPVLLAKLANRLILHRRCEYSVKEIARSVFGRPIARPDNRLPTHQGFDFRQLTVLLKQQFEIEKVSFSPFVHSPWYLNSQVFMKCVKPA